MSSRGRSIFWAIIFAWFFIFPVKVLAYDTSIAHPNIAVLAAELYNNNFSEKLTAEEIGWIKEGAMAEDTPTRWLNHFYDPVHGRGLKGKYLSAKDWAEDYSAQRNFSLGDQSWQRALDDLRKGNRELAFKELGHTIHLISDMAVPAHTRDDIHVIGDSYEQFVKNNWGKVSAHLGLSAIKINELSGAFDNLANFTNSNFYSDDTVEDNKYNIIKIFDFKTTEINKNRQALVALSKMGGSIVYNLYVESGTDWRQGMEGTKFVNNSLILTDYAQQLLPKAVGYSAGMIKLFLDEAKKDEKTDLPTWRITLRGLADRALGAVIAGAEQIYDGLKSKSAQDTLAQDSGEVSAGVSITNNQDTINQTNIKTQNPITSSEPPTEAPKKSTSASAAPNNPNSPLPAPLPILIVPPAPQVTPKTATFLSAPGYFPDSSPASANTTNAGQDNTNTSTTVNNETIEQSTSSPTSTPDNTPDTSTTTPDATPTSTPPTPPTPPDITPPPAPILDNLFAEIIYTTSSGANIFGTVSTDTVKVFSYFSATPLVLAPNSEQEGITPSSTRFDFGAVFSPGHNYFYFSATDEAKNTSTLSLPAHFVFDTDPPTVPTITVDNQTNASSTILHLTISSSDTLSPTILYDVAWRASTTNTWQDLVVATTTNQFDFSGVRGQSYLFRARAQDGPGNTSLWNDEDASSTPTFVDWSKEVVINEVAWAGNSAQYSNDEWLELYNNTDSEIDLRQWKILVSGRQINWSSVKNSIIPARGYFLLERTYDNNVRDVAADIIYTLQYGFKNTGEKIELLKPDGNKVDEVDASAGWFSGDNIKYHSMERISSVKPGSDPDNWQSNQGPRVTPRSYNGGYIYGSPRQSNFGLIVLSNTQEEPIRTLTAVNNPYVLIGYTVPAGKTLVIEPGVVIKAYRGAKIEIYGTLEAKGDSNQSVIFTSGKDQSFADSWLNTVVGTWATTTPLVKDWQGLWFRAGAIGTLNYAELRFAGYDFRPTISNLLYSQALRADSAVVNISNSNFSNTGDTMVYLNSSTSTIANSNFSNGALAVDAQQSDLILTNSSFANFSNSRGPVNIKGKWPSLSQLTFSSNAVDMAYAESVALEKDTNYPRGLNYLVIGGNLQVPSSTTLTLEAGSTLSLAKYGTITVQGTLSAPGTAENPITIQPAVSSTYWGHVKFDGSTSNVSYVNFNRGGLLTSIPANLNGALLVYNSNITLDNITVADSRSVGNSIQTGNSVVTIRNSQITKAQKYAGQDTGIKVNSGQLNLDNVILSNHNIGVQGINNGSLPGLQMSNMSATSFVNVDYPIQPTNWFAFSTSTP